MLYQLSYTPKRIPPTSSQRAGKREPSAQWKASRLSVARALGKQRIRAQTTCGPSGASTYI